ncbi:MAG: hypothetical protein LBK06_11155 [Planctomycetaceae bacterium]|nr:hypothetical protein [Planctomycetaceae bacterium]
MIINAIGTLAFGGGGIGVVAYIYNSQFTKLVTTHKEEIDRICTNHEKTVERNAKAFEIALTAQNEQLKRFIDSVLVKT